MKSLINHIIQEAKSSHHARLLVREYLQHVVLRQLFEQKVLQEWIFHGGTALRILYGTNRFSEDLDFHLKKTQSNYDFAVIVNELNRKLNKQGYAISPTRIRGQNVQSVFIKFEDLLYEHGLSPHPTEKVSIKIDLDTNPPSDFRIQRLLVNVYFPFGIICHDLSTFLSGKLHALFQRSYTKGRDFFDLIFLLSRWRDLHPNISYLQNALKQTGYHGVQITINNWRKLLFQRIEELNWDEIVADIEPFLEFGTDIQLIDKDYLYNLLSEDE